MNFGVLFLDKGINNEMNMSPATDETTKRLTPNQRFGVSAYTSGRVT